MGYGDYHCYIMRVACDAIGWRECTNGNMHLLLALAMMAVMYVPCTS